MKKDKYTNTTGYDEAYLTKLNPYNIIPSNNITMENVNQNLLGMGMNDRGEIISMKYMEPNEKYFFKNASSVMETPMYARHGGEVPKYQPGGTAYENAGEINYNINPNTNMPFIPNNNTGGINTQGLMNYDLSMGQLDLGNLDLNGVNAKNNPNMFSQVNTDTPQFNTEINTPLLGENTSGSPFGVDYQGLESDFNKTQQELDASIGSFKGEIDNVEKKRKSYRNGLFNPYASVDIPTAATFLGASIENKSTPGIVAGGLKVGLGTLRNVLGGMGAARMRDYQITDRENSLNIQNQNTQLIAREGGEVEYLKKGGQKMNEYKEGTGAYTTGLAYYDPKMEKLANSEIERGEYKKDAETQEIQEVLGKTHEQGGEKVFLKEGDQILTDHTKLGGVLAKEIRENYDLKKIKAKNTYADVLDKFKRKSGLKKATDEKEDILKKLKKQEDTGHKDTQDINTKFLIGKLQELDQNISTLEVAQKELYDFLFKKQEDAKPKEERTDEGLMYAEDGLKVGDTDPKTGKKVTLEYAEQKVASKEWEKIGDGKYIKRGTPGSTETRNSGGDPYTTVFNRFTINEKGLREDQYGNTYTNDEAGMQDFIDASEKYYQTKVVGATPDQYFYTTNPVKTVAGTKDTTTEIKTEPEGTKPLDFEDEIEMDELKKKTEKLRVFTEGLPENNQEEQSRLEQEAFDKYIREIEEKEQTQETNTGTNFGTPDMGGSNGNSGMMMMPNNYQPYIDDFRTARLNTADLRDVEAVQQDLDPYLQIAAEQQRLAERQTEGLAPEQRAAFLANANANIQDTLNKYALRMDAQNLQNRQSAEQANASTDASEQQLNIQYKGIYDELVNRSLDTQLANINNYMRSNQLQNSQNFNTINDMNLYLAQNPDITYDGRNFGSRKPFIGNYAQKGGTYMQKGGQHTVKEGDSLSKIANTYNTDLKTLLELNPKYVKNPDLIRIGEQINLNGNVEQSIESQYQDFKTKGRTPQQQVVQSRKADGVTTVMPREIGIKNNQKALLKRPQEGKVNTMTPEVQQALKNYQKPEKAEGSILGFQKTVKKELGIDPKGFDGKWGKNTQKAFEDFKEYVEKDKRSTKLPAIFKSVDAMMGERGGNLTEDNFNEDEIALLKKLAVKDGKIQDRFGYNTIRSGTSVEGSTVSDFLMSPASTLKEREAVTLALVLGQAGIVKAPDGNVYVYDVYNMNDVGEYGKDDMRTADEVYEDRIGYANKSVNKGNPVKKIYSTARAEGSRAQRKAQIEAYNKGEEWKPTATLINLGRAEDLIKEEKQPKKPGLSDYVEAMYLDPLVGLEKTIKKYI